MEVRASQESVQAVLDDASTGSLLSNKRLLDHFPSFDNLKFRLAPPTVPPLDLRRLLISVLFAEEHLCRFRASHKPGSDDVDADLFGLRDWLTVNCLPPELFARDSGQDVSHETRQLYHALSFRAALCLKHLRELHGPKQAQRLELIYLASFCDVRDPWTCAPTTQIALDLLADTCGEGSLQEILASILKEDIRPCFSGHRNPSITEAGQKALNDPARTLLSSVDERKQKPWKYRQVYIPAVFQWISQVTGTLDLKFLGTNWPLIVGPILTLIDDSDVDNKLRGCLSLQNVLRANPTAILGRTGLNTVFQDALMSCLVYLPSLVEEEQSARLLEHAYPALLSLLNVCYAAPDSRVQRNLSFDLVIRDGICKGFSYAGEHPRIAIILVQQIISITMILQSDIIKHLEALLAILTSSVSNPFISSSQPLLIACLTALHTLILNAWPRIPEHRFEILEALVACWTNSNTDHQEFRQQCQPQLRLCVKALAAAGRGEGDLGEWCREFAPIDPTTAVLFANP